jgi:hypothetical protein
MKYYESFHNGLSFTTDFAKAQYNNFDSWGQFCADILNYKISRIMLYRFISMYLLNLIQQLYLNCHRICFAFILYFLFCLMQPAFFYIILLIWFIFYYVNYKKVFDVRILVSCIIFIASLFSIERLFTLCLFPFVLLGLTFIVDRRLEKLKIQEAYISRRNVIQNYYYSRMAFYTALSCSGLISILFICSKICVIFFGKSIESKRDVATELYLPEFKKTNSDDKIRYHFIARPDHTADTTTRRNAMDYISKKLLIVQVQNRDGFFQQVSGIPMGSEVLLPAHAIPSKGLFDVTICADPSKRTSEYKSLQIPQDSYRQLRSRDGRLVDCVLLNIANMPTQADLSRYFTGGQQPLEGPGQEIYKMIDGSCEVIDLRLSTPGWLETISYPTERGTFSKYPVLKCTSQFKVSEEGMCGSPIVSEDSNCILGMHVAGSKTTTWYALRITKDMIDNAHDLLVAESSCFVSHPTPAEFVVKNNLMGFDFDDEIKDLAVEQIGAEVSPIEQIGYIKKNGELYADRAEKHYFKNENPKLEEAFGPRTTQPPKFPNGSEQINSTLKKLHNPKFGVPIDLINRAALDYLETSLDGANFDGIIRSLKETRDDFFTVRSIDEATHGDNTGIVRGINNNSSAGWIYGGKKTTHFNMEVDGDPMEIRELLPYINKDLVNQEILWRNGDGTFDPFKRCSKTNELLPLMKALEKTRSFYGNDMVYFINMTRGIIPLKHVLRTNMQLSECFVGLTAQSKQWSALKDYLTKEDEFTNFVCGDFSGYDTQLPKALLDKAAWILLEMAKRGGMSKSDLQFLRGSLSSVVSPTLLWQGHVLRMANGQPSGQPLTVEINSIVNSLLMRMVFFVIMDRHYPRKSHSSFRSLVRLATYGDDNVLGIDNSIPLYNHTMIQSVFAEWGIQYTMADKNADSVPYQKVSEISFLKRKFVEHPDLGIVAPIEYDSIVKCFYYWVRTKNTPLSFPQQFREAVKSQVREAFLHGPEFYDEFCRGIHLLQEGSQEMNEEFQIKWNGFILPTYDEMLEELRDDYK